MRQEHKNEGRAEVLKIKDYRKEDKNKEIDARLGVKEKEEAQINTSESIKKNLMLTGEEALKDAVKTFKETGFSLQKVIESVKNMAFMEDLEKEGKSEDDILRLTVEIFNSNETSK